MHGKLRGRKTEDQPAASRIDMFESEHVGQERAIGVGIAAEQDDVSAVDHPTRVPDPRIRRLSDRQDRTTGRDIRQIWRVMRRGPTQRCSPSRAPWTGTSALPERHPDAAAVAGVLLEEEPADAGGTGTGTGHFHAYP